MRIVALKSWLAGVTEPPDKLHNRTATVLVADTNILPTNPDSSVAGQPGAIGSPADAPVNVNVNCEHAACAIAANPSELDPARKLGPPPVEFTTHAPDCAVAKVTVTLFASVRIADFGKIHAAGVLLS